MGEAESAIRLRNLVASKYFQDKCKLERRTVTVPDSFDPEEYMDRLFQMDNVGGQLDAYITSELQWAEQVLQDRLAAEQARNSLPDGAASSRAGGSGPTESGPRIRAYWD
ncbi:hypothetical protein [Glaciimonas sp. PCH181]|uniref:hypothetical protein n=1 Tax=Glaciimonas sp. PCH181 TaxID=2133943 RepID=UPI000D48467E|nr:hypothetical protein [Glaciimonas sp. PCH181]PUA19019.1 hypothetical protein C7W93_03690 [Glaciimonas sp. PCH181]